MILFSFNKKVFSEESIKIGLIVPLTGEYKEIGESIVKATRLATNKINDTKIEIFPRDTEADPNTTLLCCQDASDDTTAAVGCDTSLVQGQSYYIGITSATIFKLYRSL